MVNNYSEKDNSYYLKVKNDLNIKADIRSLEYSSRIAELSKNCKDNIYLKQLKIIQNENITESFNAFFVLCTYYRRNKDYELMLNNIENHKCFKDNYLYEFINMQYLVHSESMFDYEYVLNIGYKYASECKQNPGFSQGFVNAYVTICEQCDDDGKNIIQRKWKNLAIEYIDSAIKLNENYAKYYCTKGRIYILDGKYNEAIQQFNTAISKETSDRPDYALTISNYQYYKALAVFEQKLKLVKDKIEKIIDIDIKNEENSEFLDLIKKYSYLNVYEGKNPFVFISYSHLDSNIVFQTIDIIQKNNFNYWFDKGIKPTAEWPEILGKHINDCKVLLLFLSYNSIKSLNVRREITQALSNNKKIIVVKIDNAELTPGMSLQLNLEQMIDINKYKDNLYVDDILKIVKENLDE